MSILSDLNTLLNNIVPVETGVFSGVAPDEYIVITPLTDSFELYGDNHPEYETQEARLSLYSKNNYTELKNRIISTLIAADFTITARQYIAHEDDTGYHHYAIDAAKIYALEGI